MGAGSVFHTLPERISQFFVRRGGFSQQRQEHKSSDCRKEEVRTALRRFTSDDWCVTDGKLLSAFCSLPLICQHR